jgi:hypothetical protein
VNLAANRFVKKARDDPRFFDAHYLSNTPSARLRRPIVATLTAVLQKLEMVLDPTSTVSERIVPVVIDDRSRLPGRFFGRFATSATSELTRVF